jgi:DNA-binding NtrC family response regulator
VLAGAKDAAVTRELVEPWLLPGKVTVKAMPLRAAPIQGVVSNGYAHTNGNGHSVMHPGPNGHGNGHPVPLAIGFAEAKPLEMPGDRTLEEIERDTIVATLERFNGHRQRTAKALGIGVRTLGLKLKKWKDESLVSANL